MYVKHDQTYFLRFTKAPNFEFSLKGETSSKTENKHYIETNRQQIGRSTKTPTGGEVLIFNSSENGLPWQLEETAEKFRLGLDICKLNDHCENSIK